jgi:hypothetical protein
MIKVQHWKMYAAHYNNDSSGIGIVMMRIQSAYQHYKGMGVPISGESLSRSRKPNLDGVFPYRYEETTEEDYNLALSVEMSNCCVSFYEFFSSTHHKDDDKIEWLKQDLEGDNNQTESFTCEFTADDVDNVTLQTPQKSKHMPLGEETKCVEKEMR